MSDRDITLREFVEHGIEHMEVLRVQPGDVCVLRCSHELPLDAVDRLNHGWEHAFRGAAVPRLIVLDGNLTLGVLRPNATKESDAVPMAMAPGSTTPEPGWLAESPARLASDKSCGCLGVGPERSDGGGEATAQGEAASTSEPGR